jgi:transcription termination factor Rho
MYKTFVELRPENAKSTCGTVAVPPSLEARVLFQDHVAVHPSKRMRLETDPHEIEMRVMDLFTPLGKGQRGLIVSPARTGKTTLLQKLARSILHNHPECHIIVLLIGERPEEVTDMRIRLESSACEVRASTFDKEPRQHRQVAETALAHAKSLAEVGSDVVILADSITRLARACNALAPAGAKIMSGGIAAGALDWPKRFFGSARQLEGSGSLTILATALLVTESRMDEVIFQEFKGTGNMELHLDRRLSDRRIWPAIDIQRSGTRREELMVNSDELRAVNLLRRATSDLNPAEAMEFVIARLRRSKSNAEFLKGVAF